MASEDKASLHILVQNRKKECIFSITFVSNRSYEAALQEAIGLGQRLLKNEKHAVRVEIRDEHTSNKKPQVILTSDDIAYIDHSARKSRVRQLIRHLLKA